jgi:hypothetical protein
VKIPAEDKALVGGMHELSVKEKWLGVVEIEHSLTQSEGRKERTVLSTTVDIATSGLRELSVPLQCRRIQSEVALSSATRRVHPECQAMPFELRADSLLCCAF